MLWVFTAVHVERISKIVLFSKCLAQIGELQFGVRCLPQVSVRPSALPKVL